MHAKSAGALAVVLWAWGAACTWNRGGSGFGSQPAEDAGTSQSTSSGGEGGSADGARDAAPGGSSGGSHDAGRDVSSGDSGGGDAGSGAAPLFSPYKDTSIAIDPSTNVISTEVTGATLPLTSDMAAEGARTVTLAFATGACGTERWAGTAGDVIASANVSLLQAAGIRYIVSTGGASGSFTCASDSGFATFVGRWMSPGLVGIDFDIESGQTQTVIKDLVMRVQAAHATFPSLRFSLTIATEAVGGGGGTAQSLGSAAPDALGAYGDETMSAVKSVLGFTGTAATWPSYVTVNLMTMNYGATSSSSCIISNGSCQMGQSAMQAAYDLHDKWGVPYTSIEITPMIGGNDEPAQHFTLADVDTVAAFARTQGLAGIHFWSYDRDTDCPTGQASATCNSMGNGYAGSHGYLKRFIANGL